MQSLVNPIFDDIVDSLEFKSKLALKLTNRENLNRIQINKIKEKNQLKEDDIKYFTLFELNLSDNRYIKNISSYESIKVLDISNNSIADQQTISKLDLIQLNTWYNEKVYTVNHMKSLEILYKNKSIDNSKLTNVLIKRQYDCCSKNIKSGNQKRRQ